MTTITFSVIRSYMEIDRDKYERITQQAQQDKKNRETKMKENENKWDLLNKRYRIAPQAPIFPLVQWKPPEGFEDNRY